MILMILMITHDELTVIVVVIITMARMLEWHIIMLTRYFILTMNCEHCNICLSSRLCSNNI